METRKGLTGSAETQRAFPSTERGEMLENITGCGCVNEKQRNPEFPQLHPGSTPAQPGRCHLKSCKGSWQQHQQQNRFWSNPLYMSSELCRTFGLDFPTLGLWRRVLCSCRGERRDPGADPCGGRMMKCTFSRARKERKVKQTFKRKLQQWPLTFETCNSLAGGLRANQPLSLV